MSSTLTFPCTAAIKRNVSGPFEILVATMGRPTQLVERKLVLLADLKILVFDEADQMLERAP